MMRQVLSGLSLTWGLTHLHRLSGLPSVWGSCTIASPADATAVNLTALAWHSTDLPDSLPVRVLRLDQGNLLPSIGPVSSFGPEPITCPSDWASSS